MSAERYRGLGVAVLFIGLTVVMTWPQALRLSTHVYDSDDPLLSIWRISWIAHIIPESPADLLNGNIFHPEKRTLAYTDSVLLEGLAGAPLIWSGVSRVTTYNLLLLFLMALSGWAMWRYALYLTGHSPAAILAGIIFAFVPFRFDHLHHLELQATIFLPLTLLLPRADARHRLTARCVADDGVLCCASVFVHLLFGLSCHRARADRRSAPLADARRGARADAFARLPRPTIAALAVVAPYGLAYAQNRATLGERLDKDILLYSATLSNYLATTAFNTVHGGWSAHFGQSERFLFPGVIAIVMAGLGVTMFDRRRATIAALGVIGFVISLGLNSPFYDPLRAVVFPYRGLRAPARASILVYLALAALAAYGWTRVMRGRSMRVTTVATIAVASLLLLEFRTTLDRWLTVPERPAEVYQWLATQPRSVVAEIPFAQSDRLHEIHDGLYMFNSTWHWQPIVNGYSGFFPKTFMDLAEQTSSFPDDRSIAYLKQRGVDLLVIHGSLMEPERFGEMTAALLARPDIDAMAQFEERMGLDVVFRLRR